MPELIARWESRGGKQWFELLEDDNGLVCKSSTGQQFLGDIPIPQGITQVERATKKFAQSTKITIKRTI